MSEPTYAPEVLSYAQRMRDEAPRWGDWCTECRKPQWVLPNGEHACATIEELRVEIDRLRDRCSLFGQP